MEKLEARVRENTVTGKAMNDASIMSALELDETYLKPSRLAKLKNSFQWYKKIGS